MEDNSENKTVESPRKRRLNGRKLIVRWKDRIDGIPFPSCKRTSSPLSGRAPSPIPLPDVPPLLVPESVQSTFHQANSFMPNMENWGVSSLSDIMSFKNSRFGNQEVMVVNWEEEGDRVNDGVPADTPDSPIDYKHDQTTSNSKASVSPIKQLQTETLPSDTNSLKAIQQKENRDIIAVLMEYAAEEMKEKEIDSFLLETEPSAYAKEFGLIKKDNKDSDYNDNQNNSTNKQSLIHPELNECRFKPAVPQSLHAEPLKPLASTESSRFKSSPVLENDRDHIGNRLIQAHRRSTETGHRTKATETIQSNVRKTSRRPEVKNKMDDDMNHEVPSKYFRNSTDRSGQRSQNRQIIGNVVQQNDNNWHRQIQAHRRSPETERERKEMDSRRSDERRYSSRSDEIRDELSTNKFQNSIDTSSQRSQNRQIVGNIVQEKNRDRIGDRSNQAHQRSTESGREKREMDSRRPNEKKGMESFGVKRVMSDIDDDKNKEVKENGRSVLQPSREKCQYIPISHFQQQIAGLRHPYGLSS
uniref:Chromo domain-containing protein n=1 Tax=Caenorhabditis tropicalis TaxID=1561998 RepID=A0A1I7TIF8_9PELO